MVTFYRTQQPCFDAMHDDEVCFQTFIEGQRFYGSFADQHAFADYILREDNHCNELLFSHIKLGYFDLDASGLTIQELGWQDAKQFVQEFTMFLIEMYEKHLGVKLQPKHILWADSTTPEKLSFHITVDHNDYYWSKEKKVTDFKNFLKILEQETLARKGFYFLDQEKRHGSDEVIMRSVIDASVASKNRCFRALGCKKPEKENTLVPLKYGDRVDITPALVRKFLITLPESEIEDRKEPVLKTKFTKKRKRNVSRNLIDQLAKQYQSEVVKISGSLITLKNATACRKCPINGENNTSDNAFFIRKDNCIFYGCHNDACQGMLHKIHQLESRFKYYEDYQQILNTPATERATGLIREYLLATTGFLDKPDSTMYVSYSKQGGKVWKDLSSRKCVVTKTLFRGPADIVVECSDADKPVKFSGVLRNLSQSRKLKVYNSSSWCPFIKSHPVLFPMNKLNTFSHFSLDNDEIECNVNFETTHLYELLQRICNFDEGCVIYLLNFIAMRLQKVGTLKPGIALCFLKSKQGSGKGTFKAFLKSLFGCSKTTVVSYDKLSQFTSPFNAELQHAIWLCLEEINSKVREISGLIKNICTTEEIMLEPKGVDRFNCEFYGTLLMFSNKIRSLNIPRNDRRMCVIESNSDMANKKEYFDPIYKEINDMEVMRSAFLYFSQRDISEFDFRKFPKTKLREQVQKCSDSFEYKFYKELFTNYLHPHNGVFQLCEVELYTHWKYFSAEYGSVMKRDRGYVCASFESEFSPEIAHDCYRLDEEDVRCKLKDLIGLQ